LKQEVFRHFNVSIGHAVSQDLRRWEVLPDALRPSPALAWDDYTTWTGSIIKHDNRWHLFYTGTCQAERAWVQRIGLATSPDLLHWEKHPANPLIEADGRWYELLDLSVWEDQAWRDPWVFQHPDTGEFHALITARVKEGVADGRGVIGQARSHDLLHWEVGEPLTAPGAFGKLECPQLVAIEGRYYLLFCTLASTTAAAHTQRLGRPPVTGTHYLVGDNPLGPFRYSTDEFLVGDEVGSLFTGKLIQGPEGAWSFLAWRFLTPAGEFIGELSDPYPVSVDEAGNLRVAW
jgi:beta-fructofuranosidase